MGRISRFLLQAMIPALSVEIESFITRLEAAAVPPDTPEFTYRTLRNISIAHDTWLVITQHEATREAVVKHIRTAGGKPDDCLVRTLIQMAAERLHATRAGRP